MEDELNYPLTVTVKDLVTQQVYELYHVNKGYCVHEVFFRFTQQKKQHPDAFMTIENGTKPISKCNKR